MGDYQAKPETLAKATGCQIEAKKRVKPEEYKRSSRKVAQLLGTNESCER